MWDKTGQERECMCKVRMGRERECVCVWEESWARESMMVRESANGESGARESA